MWKLWISSVAILSLLYCPALYYLKDMHDYKPYEGEEPGVVMKDPPAKEFQTIALQESSMTANGYQQQYAEQETNFANFEQASFVQQQPQQAAPAAPNPNANPFKAQAPNNPFRK